MKKYKLKKELPDSKPGDIYIWKDSEAAYYKNGNVEDSFWTAEHVENNPEWFEEQKDYEILYYGGMGTEYIASIKRLSDNAIFGIGNTIGIIGSGKRIKIDKFSLERGELIAWEKLFGVPIDMLFKIQYQQASYNIGVTSIKFESGTNLIKVFIDNDVDKIKTKGDELVMAINFVLKRVSANDKECTCGESPLSRRIDGRYTRVCDDKCKYYPRPEIKISAIFTGTDGSLGYVNGRTYLLTLSQVLGNIHIEGEGVRPCVYSSVVKFLENWMMVSKSHRSRQCKG